MRSTWPRSAGDSPSSLFLVDWSAAREIGPLKMKLVRYISGWLLRRRLVVPPKGCK